MMNHFTQALGFTFENPAKTGGLPESQPLMPYFLSLGRDLHPDLAALRAEPFSLPVKNVLLLLHLDFAAGTVH
jgi:hypothetical protein